MDSLWEMCDLGPYRTFPPKLRYIVRDLQRDPDYYKSLDDEYLYKKFNRLGFRLHYFNHDSLRFEKLLDALTPTLPNRENLVDRATVKFEIDEAVFDDQIASRIRGWEVIMPLLASQTDINPSIQGLWEDVQRLMADIKEIIARIEKKLKDLKDENAQE